ncbi:NYN domain-containing protein [Cocleimonas sp. KMM 6892]|uniref:NYN domain-containing protein n=1 Tax=unclassified Cocleimonas TaxID=2639732 RepID=UPI002DB984E9|nr:MULTISPECIES: NYN domain-containing protein [unclassified Cocleimonas]MEB8432025.1 NYN domain-containing protein [Cocleimonas sp. KMM 6892]MEC4714889.1 NYN domain-containing protein [Cocleimonas sp. KMM 6895]MEC4744297.1 NYN domain-containing protein [Cocleimonas sp. KMM 6896]
MPIEKMENIALLIDADNSPSKFIQEILSELAGFGKVNIRKAYGNWTSSNLKSWEAIIQDHAIQPIQQYDLTKGKNATDIALTIDAMDILYTKNTDAFCIVSSDCDFTPLVTRILSEGKPVIGYGQRKAPAVFVNACSKFLYLDDEITELPVKNTTRNITKELQKNGQLVKLLNNSVKTTQEDDGWSKLSRVGTLISNHASFDSRNYGFTRLSDLIEAIGLFELKREGTTFIVKSKIVN